MPCGRFEELVFVGLGYCIAVVVASIVCATTMAAADLAAAISSSDLKAACEIYDAVLPGILFIALTAWPGFIVTLVAGVRLRARHFAFSRSAVSPRRSWRLASWRLF